MLSGTYSIVHNRTNQKLSLVAIHGQGGHWRASWTSEAMNIFWLHDFLPNIVPNSRILSYGYGASKSSITAVEDLLCGLELLRRDSHVSGITIVDLLSPTDMLLQTKERPIIFIAHSFGGILLKAVSPHLW